MLMSLLIARPLLVSAPPHAERAALTPPVCIPCSPCTTPAAASRVCVHCRCAPQHAERAVLLINDGQPQNAADGVAAPQAAPAAEQARPRTAVAR